MKWLAPVLLFAALSGCLDELVYEDEHVPDDGLGESVPRPPTAPPEEAPPEWPVLSDATIRPGVKVTGAGQCTSNFLFTSPDNSTLYLGLAAHCFGKGESTDTNGCTTESHPLGSQAQVQGASQPAVLVYSSWITMQENGESDSSVCRANDFALVQLHADDRHLAHPAMLRFGGPTELAGAGASTGSRVLSYGNTQLRDGFSQMDEREGVIVNVANEGWTYTVYTAGPGLPGDSGSGVLTLDGKALGVLVTLGLAPLPASNGVTDLARVLAYAHDAEGLQVELATWEQLDDGILP